MFLFAGTAIYSCDLGGFRIQEPLWQVEPGEYGLSLVMVLSDGSVCQTGRLALVTVLP